MTSREKVFVGGLVIGGFVGMLIGAVITGTYFLNIIS